eukprot:gene14991-17722_t
MLYRQATAALTCLRTVELPPDVTQLHVDATSGPTTLSWRLSQATLCTTSGCTLDLCGFSVGLYTVNGTMEFDPASTLPTYRVNATELQQRAGHVALAPELKTQALVDLKGERAAAATNLRKAALATGGGQSPAGPLLGSESWKRASGDLEPPPPPLSCEIAYLDTRSYLFDVPSVVPRATSAPTAALGVTDAAARAPDSREEDEEEEAMMDEETPTATPTPTTAGPTTRNASLSAGEEQPDMVNRTWWPDLGSLSSGRKLLARKGASGGKRTSFTEGDRTIDSQAGTDSTGSEGQEEVLSVYLNKSFQVPTYLVRGANRVVGGMLVELRREERTSAVDFDNKHCTRRFAMLGAACRDPSLPTPDKVGLDAVFHDRSDLYDPLVVEAAGSYYNLSHPAGEDHSGLLEH